MRQQWFPGQRLQHLGQLRAHARALPGGENDDAQTQQMASRILSLRMIHEVPECELASGLVNDRDVCLTTCDD